MKGKYTKTKEMALEDTIFPPFNTTKEIFLKINLLVMECYIQRKVDIKVSLKIIILGGKENWQ